jgi:hypothetical protein
MSDRQPYGTTFTGLLAIELLAAVAILVIAITLVEINAATIDHLLDLFE